MTSRSDFTAIGRRIPRYDARDRVTGSARYGADQARPETLWAKLVRSPYPHARIVSIDTSKALALSGVHAVVTGADLPPKTRWGRRTIDVQVLAQGEALFAGEQVAAVIGDDEEIAQRGANLVEVTYEELPAVTDAVEALKDGAIIVHPDIMEFQGLVHPLDKPTNAVVTEEWSKGDADTGFKDADLVIENTYTTPTVHQVYMEPHNCTVQAHDDGSVDVWAPVKAPYALRGQMARAIGVDPLAIVFHPVSIGGDFGGKGSPMNVPLCYFLSKAVGGRPVQAVFEYAEEFMAGNPRHPSVMKVRTGVKKDGTITAHEVSMVFNSGASAGYKPAGFLLGARGAAGFYRVPNVRVTEYMVYTHSVPCGHMRGPGEPQALFALECQIDEVARALKMDPVEFRLMNFAGDGEPLGLGEEYIENRSGETLRAALSASNYTKAKSDASKVKIGRAVAMGERSPGGGQNNAQVTMNSDGSVSVQTPLFEQGAGGVTVTQQIVAETMGLPAERVRIEVQDTGLFEDDSGIGGSRVTNVGGIAADMAVKEAHQEIFKLAAELQNWPEEQLAIKGDKLVRSDTGESQDWKDLLARTDQPVIGRGTYAERGSNVTGYCAQIAEVSVDTDTGEIKLLKLTTAHDTGTIINPLGHQGQINGGAMMGIGYGLMEEIKTEAGHIETLSFADYKIPSMADIPEFETVLLEPSIGVGPYGIKAIGESPNAPTAAAIANAVEDAVGIRIRDLPVTAEKVYAALQASRK
jgi:xanthine dehydrogenase molybdenum-binding subunit